MSEMTMSEPRVPPEIPYPYRPWTEPPPRPAPLAVPVVDLPAAEPRDQLFDRRTVLVSGRLDGRGVTHLCAQLMALDGRSPAAIELLLNSPGGPLAEIAAVLDVFDLMRARVNVTCVGMAHGTAAVLLALAPGERRAGSNARISLRVEATDADDATADELKRRADEHEAQLRRLAATLAAATGQPADVIAGELDSGAVHGAADAVILGIVDRVVTRS